MTVLTEKSLEEAIVAVRALCAERGERLSFEPSYVVYRPSDLDDPRNVVKLLRNKLALPLARHMQETNRILRETLPQKE